jgi:4-carboxymuconolactone decarboxylase
MTKLSRLLTLVVLVFLFPRGVAAQDRLPSDIDPVTRNRLPAIAGATVTHGPAAIRLHGSGIAVRWVSPLGRALTELAILTSAREHDQPYEWSLHELEGIAVGLDPAVIDVVRHRRPLTGLPEKESIIIQLGREIFSTDKLSSETYARALRILGKTNLVDIVALMGDYSGTAARLTAVNQHMPAGWKQFLPLPFTMPDDINPDTRSRLPLNQTQAPLPATPPALYSRTIAPEGTGPTHIRRHAGGMKSLEASVGRRLMGLAILITAREHNGQYQWTMNELASIKDGLDPQTIDVVRHRRPVTGLPEKEAALIEFGRELFGKHTVSPQTYARALKAFGTRDLVDFTDLMGQHAGDATVLAAFDQHLPAGQKALLPVP